MHHPASLGIKTHTLLFTLSLVHNCGITDTPAHHAKTTPFYARRQKGTEIPRWSTGRTRTTPFSCNGGLLCRWWRSQDTRSLRRKPGPLALGPSPCPLVLSEQKAAGAHSDCTRVAASPACCSPNLPHSQVYLEISGNKPRPAAGTF